MGRPPFRTLCGGFVFVLAAGCAGATLGPSLPSSNVGTAYDVAAKSAVTQTALYVAYPANNAVEVFPASGSTPIEKITVDVKKPVDVVVNAGGDLYIADASTDSVYEYHAGASKPYASISGIDRPTGSAVDADGNLYLSSASAKTVSVYAFDAKSGRLNAKPSRTVHTGAAAPFGIAVDAAGTIFIANPNGSDVESIAPKATAPKLYVKGSGTVEGVAVEGSGKSETLYVSSSSAAVIKTFINGKEKGTIKSGLVHPDLLALASNGKLYVADGGDSGFVVAYAVHASIPSEKITGFGVPGGLAVGSIPVTTPTPSPAPSPTPYSGPILYVADPGRADIAKYPISDGSPAPLGTITNGLTKPNLLAADGEGNLFVDDLTLSQILEYPSGRKSPRDTGVPIIAGCRFTNPNDNIGGCGFALDAHNNLWVSGSTTLGGKTYPSLNQYVRGATRNSWTEEKTIAGVNGKGNTFYGIFAAVVDASGNAFVLDSSGDVYVNSDGASKLTGLGQAIDVVIDGNRLYIAAFSGAQIMAFDLATVIANAALGAATAPVETIHLPTGSSTPAGGLAFDADGDLFVADRGHGCVDGFMAASISSSASVVTPTPFETICGFSSQLNGIAVTPRASLTSTPSPTPSPTPSATPTATPTPSELVATPTSLTFTSPAAQTIGVQDSGYDGTLTATSSNTGIATVSPSSGNGPNTTFTVTPVGGGTCTIAIQDGIGHTANVSVTVNSGVVIIDRAHATHQRGGPK